MTVKVTFKETTVKNINDFSTSRQWNLSSMDWKKITVNLEFIPVKISFNNGSEINNFQTNKCWQNSLPVDLHFKRDQWVFFGQRKITSVGRSEIWKERKAIKIEASAGWNLYKNMILKNHKKLTSRWGYLPTILVGNYLWLPSERK